jgi:hypothetical protein
MAQTIFGGTPDPARGDAAHAEMQASTFADVTAGIKIASGLAMMPV